MFSDKTALTLCGLTLVIFFLSGLFDFLSNPFVIGGIILIYVAIIINLIVVKKKSNDIETK